RKRLVRNCQNNLISFDFRLNRFIRLFRITSSRLSLMLFPIRFVLLFLRVFAGLLLFFLFSLAIFLGFLGFFGVFGHFGLFGFLHFFLGLLHGFFIQKFQFIFFLQVLSDLFQQTISILCLNILAVNFRNQLFIAIIALTDATLDFYFHIK